MNRQTISSTKLGKGLYVIPFLFIYLLLLLFFLYSSKVIQAYEVPFLEFDYCEVYS